jgi:hypothetical protein
MTGKKQRDGLNQRGIKVIATVADTRLHRHVSDGSFAQLAHATSQTRQEKRNLNPDLVYREMRLSM